VPADLDAEATNNDKPIDAGTYFALPGRYTLNVPENGLVEGVFSPVLLQSGADETAGTDSSAARPGVSEAAHEAAVEEARSCANSAVGLTASCGHVSSFRMLYNERCLQYLSDYGLCEFSYDVDHYGPTDWYLQRCETPVQTYLSPDRATYEVQCSLRVVRYHYYVTQYYFLNDDVDVARQEAHVDVAFNVEVNRAGTARVVEE
jgi:hypothetical protein